MQLMLFPLPAVNMDGRQTGEVCKFDILFTKSVPHILEKVFFSLDYESFKVCPNVNSTWRDLLITESYQKERKSVFHREILDDEEKLFEAAKKGNVDNVQHLLSSIFVDVNCAPRWALSSPLLVAARYGHKLVVKVLLDRGADPNKAGTTTPLYSAARKGHKDVVQLLLDNGANPNEASNLDGWAPLIMSASFGHKDVVQLLLDRGADPNEADEDGETPLHLAAKNSSKDVVQILLDKGANPNTADNIGIAPLHHAARHGHKEVVQLLLNRGADPDTISLQYAAGYAHTDVIQLLLERGSDPNQAEPKS